MAPRYDFSSPFCAVTIVQAPKTDSEQRFPLWTSGSQSDPSLLKPVKLNGYVGGPEAQFDISSLAFVSSVEVTLRLGDVSDITVTLTPPLPEARKFMESTAIEYAISAIEVSFGYSTGTNGSFISPTFQGMLDPPSISFGTDVSITMKATGTAGYLLAATGGAGTYVTKKRSQHIADLVAKLTPQIAPFSLNDCVLDDKSRAALDIEVPFATAGRSYLNMIYLLAAQAGCWVQTAHASGFDKISLVARDAVPKTTEVAVLALYDFPYGNEVGTDVAGRGVYPILSVNIDNAAGAFFGPWAKIMRSAVIDANNLERKESDTKPEDIATSGTAGSNQTGVKNASSENSVVVADLRQSSAEDPQVANQNRAQQVSNTNAIGIEMTVETVGIPDAIPATIYRVMGLGSRIDGWYMLNEVTHSVSGSGFTSSLKLVQNSQLMTMALKDGVAGTPRPNTPASGEVLIDFDSVQVTATPQDELTFTADELAAAGIV